MNRIVSVGIELTHSTDGNLLVQKLFKKHHILSNTKCVFSVTTIHASKELYF